MTYGSFINSRRELSHYPGKYIPFALQHDAHVIKWKIVQKLKWWK